MPVTVKVGPNVTSSSAFIVPDASTVNDGVMTAAMVNQLNQCSQANSQGDVAIYLSTTGNDNNKGTQQKPVKTLAAAIALLPASNRGKCRIFAADGTYPLSDTLNLFTGTALGPTGTPLAIIGGYKNAGFGTLTATANSAGGLVLTVAGTPFTPGALRNLYLTGKTGVNTGVRCSIQNNTNHTITVAGQFLGGDISIGDKFIVETESVIFSGNNLTVLGIFGMRGIKWVLTGEVQTPDAQIYAEGCTIDGQGFAFFEGFPNSAWFAAFANAERLWVTDGADNPFDETSRFFAGLNFIGIPDMALSDSLVDGVFLWTDCDNVSLDGCDAFLVNSSARGSQLAALANGTIVSVNFFGNPGSFENVIVRGGNAELGGVDISNPSGNGIDITGGGVVTLDQDVTGTSVGGVGVQISETGTCIFPPAAAATMPSGDGGDAKVGATVFAAGAWAGAVLPVTGYTYVNAGGPTGNRITPFGL